VRPIAIVGPTGTGKSALALAVAEQVGGEIVNADAMQLYRGMDIGTAKLPESERRGIPHHQLDVLDVTETATVAGYQQAAAADIEAIAARGAVPIVIGGSMMYIQSLLDEWSFPATDAAVRAKWEGRLAEVGVGALHGELARVDADAAASILPTDGRRIVRALEVVELTGQPFAASAPVIGPPRWDTAIVGRVAYQVLAGLAPSVHSAKELYRGAPYGVGYFAGVWLPVGRSTGGTSHPKGRATPRVSTQ